MKTFISHTAQDKDLATDVATRFSREGVWFDTWNMDSGDVLLDEIEKGIDQAKTFLLILSKSALNSPWVRYELNMGILKYLMEEDYRIVIARTDDVKIPLKLQPFQHIDVSNSSDQAGDIFTQIIEISSSKGVTLKRQFVNRNNELGSIEDALHDDNIKFISIIGLYGIGKSSLVREAVKRFYTNTSVVEVILSAAHFGSRLTLELCAKAGIDLPADGAAAESLRNFNMLAIETIVSKKQFLIFNKVETLLDDEGELHDDLKNVISYFHNMELLRGYPIFLLSTRWPSLKFIPKTELAHVRVAGVSGKHLTNIISSEISRIDPVNNYTSEKIATIASLLHGYPLAAKLASPLIVKYGTDYLSADFRLLQSLKIDIAEEIISKIPLAHTEIAILEVLAIFGHPLKAIHISEIIEIDESEFTKSIDNLVSFNLLSSNGRNLLLHPLINDYYVKVARNNTKFHIYTEKLADLSLGIFDTMEASDVDYVFWLTNTCRMLFYCNRLEEAHQLRRDLIGELKSAAIKLFHDQEYGRSLELSKEFLETVPNDKDMLFIKARCLSRLGARDESITILQTLLAGETSSYRKAKFNFALGRVFIETGHKDDKASSELAKAHLLESIKLNEHESALQSLGELLLREENYVEAELFIEKKLELSPADPFAFSIYSEILWQTERKAQAIEKILEALRYKPNDAKFNFRAGRFLLESEKPSDAYGFFLQAVKNDETYLDARLSLCDVCITLERFEEVQAHLEYLRKKVKNDKLPVLESISAGYLLKIGKVEEAELAGTRALKAQRNVVTLGLMAKINLHKSRQSKSKGLNLMAEAERQKANEFIIEGLKLDHENVQLHSMLKQL